MATVGVTVGVVIVVFVIVAVAGVSRLFGLGFGVVEDVAEPEPTPRAGVSLYAATDSNAARAAQTDARFEGLAAIPQARWLSDWTTVDNVEQAVADYVGAASAVAEIPALVLYKIPDRDCGLYAAGGLADADEYVSWVDAVVRGLSGAGEVIVIVEPDALAMASQCEDEEGREALIADAVHRLSSTSATIYIDAGHSDWLDPDEMARRLMRAGVAEAQGFSTNVSNFQNTDDEIRYAEAVRAALESLGVSDAHYVIDTSRNGSPVPAGDVCNPPDARVGDLPQLFTGTALDGFLWVKAPGEPDGPCNGAPIGQYFWPEGALQLLGFYD